MEDRERSLVSEGTKALNLQCWHARCTLDPDWTTVKATGRPFGASWLSAMSSSSSSVFSLPPSLSAAAAAGERQEHHEDKEGEAWGGKRRRKKG